MPEFIYHFPNVLLLAFLSLALTSISFIAVTLVRRHIPLDFRYEENTAIMSCTALLGIIYAILIGFTILYELSAFDKADRLENIEGATLYNIYRNAGFLPKEDSIKIRTLVIEYAQNAINSEWPALNKGKKVDPKGRILIETLAHDIQALHPDTSKNTKEANALSTLAEDANVLFHAHHDRAATIQSSLNGHIWLVLILGTLCTLGMNYILGMDYRLHLFCVTVISIVMSSVLYLIIGLERPYQGDFAIQPETIHAILEFIT